MLYIAICDDQELHLAIVHKALEHYLSEKRLEAEIQDFTSAFDLVSSSENGAFYDIVILDICLPGLSGTEGAKEIMQRNSNVSLIFLSVSRDYAVEAFAIGAVHYLLKPFTDEEFSEAMDRAVSRKGMVKHLMVNTAGGHVEAVDVDSILYIESVAYKREIHTDTAVYEETKQTLGSLMKALEKLAPGQFIQPYRGYIVNQAVIKTVSPEKIILSDDTSIIIKRGDFRRIRDGFLGWSFGNVEADNA